MIGSRGGRGYGLSLCCRRNGVLRLEGSHAEGETAKQRLQGRGPGQKRIRRSGLDDGKPNRTGEESEGRRKNWIQRTRC